MTEQHLSVPLELVNAPQTFNFMFLQFQAVCGKVFCLQIRRCGYKELW